MQITRETVIQAAKESYSMESLAEQLGIENEELDWNAIESICPGFEKLVQRNQVAAELKRLKDRGEDKLAHVIRRDLVGLTADIMGMGLSLPVMASPPAPKEEPKADKTTAKKAKPAKVDKPAEEVIESSEKEVKEESLEPVGISEFKSDVAFQIVKGFLRGQTYQGRRIAVVRMVPGLFGAGCVNKESTRHFTVHKGIINHSDIRKQGSPSPYWMVMDVMSDLETFTKKSVVAESVKRLKECGAKDSDEALTLEERCSTAFNVLKTHHIHPSKKNSGLTHMCDTDPAGTGDKKAIKIRGRRAEETLAHFNSAKSDTKRSQEDGKPIRSVFLKEPV